MNAATVYYGTVVDTAKLLDKPDGRTAGYRVTQEVSCVIVWRERWGMVPAFESTFVNAQRSLAIERAVQLALAERKT